MATPSAICLGAGHAVIPDHAKNPNKRKLLKILRQFSHVAQKVGTFSKISVVPSVEKAIN